MRWNRPTPEPEEGAPPTFEEVYAEAFDYVWHILRRMGIRDEEERADAVQDVFSAIHRSLPTYQPPPEAARDPKARRRALLAWVHGVTFYTAKNYRELKRHEREQRMEETFEPIDRQADPERRTQDRERVLFLLDALPADLRIVVEMHEIEGYTAPEIARALSRPETPVPLSTIYERMRDGMARLRSAATRLEAREQRAGAGVFLPIDLAALFAADRPMLAPPAGVQARVWERLQHSLDLGSGGDGFRPGVSGSAPAPGLAMNMGSLTGRLVTMSLGRVAAAGVALVMLGAGLGAGGLYAFLHRDTEVSAAITREERAAPVTTTSAVATAEPSSTTAHAGGPTAPTSTFTAAKPSERTHEDDDDDEDRLLRQARSAIAHDNTDAALAAVREYEEKCRTFKGGCRMKASAEQLRQQALDKQHQRSGPRSPAPSAAPSSSGSAPARRLFGVSNDD